MQSGLVSTVKCVTSPRDRNISQHVKSTLNEKSTVFKVGNINFLMSATLKLVKSTLKLV